MYELYIITLRCLFTLQRSSMLAKHNHLKLSVSMKPKRMILNKIYVNPCKLESSCLAPL